MSVPTNLSDPWPNGPRRPWDPPSGTTPRDGNASAGPDADPEAGEFGFLDFLDIVNPLQHIPLINIAYREITGDEIGGPARILGGALFGGPVGLLSGAFQAILEEATGRDAGEHVMATLFGDDEQAAPAVATAPVADPAAPPAADVGAAPSAVLLRDRVPVGRLAAPYPWWTGGQPAGLPPAPHDEPRTAVPLGQRTPERFSGAAPGDIPAAMMRALDVYQRAAGLAGATAG